MSSTLQSPPVRVEVADTREAVEAMRDAWQAAGVRHIDSDIEYFLAVVDTSDSVIRPHVVRIRRPGRADIFGIARLERYPLRLALGYHTLACPTLTAVVVTFGGIVGAETDADAVLVLRELRRPLDAGTAEALVIREVELGGPVHAAARRSSRFWRVHGKAVDVRMRADVPASLDAFLRNRSASARRTILRQERALLAAHGDAIRLQRATEPADAAGLLNDVEAVAASTYQRGLGVGFHTGPVTRTLTELGLRRGWLKAWLLYIDDRPVAYWTGWTYAGTFGHGTTGYDPRYARESVGRFTMHRMIEDICQEPEIRQIDLGHGDAPYKKAFIATRTRETDVVILARRPRAAVLGAAASSLALANRLGRNVAARSVVAARLVRTWKRGSGQAAPRAGDR